MWSSRTSSMRPTTSTWASSWSTGQTAMPAPLFGWRGKSRTYRRAIDWLNRKTGPDVSFYALEIELWRSGDSPPAPKFNVVCAPNELAKAEKIGEELTAWKQLQLEFWKVFSDYVETHDSSF